MNTRALVTALSVVAIAAGGAGLGGTGAETRPAAAPSAQSGTANEVHGGDVKGPFPHHDRFILIFDYDVTAKSGPMAGQRMQMQEAGLYTVADGKIVKEEFFYDMGE